MTNGISQSIILGVFSGILTSLFINIFYDQLIIKIFLPWLKNYLYRGVYLDGVWNGGMEMSAKDGHKYNLRIQIELKQSGNILNGSFIATTVFECPHHDHEKDEYTNRYFLDGNVTDNYCVMVYKPSSIKRIGYGTFLLQVKDGGNKLIGLVTFVEESDMELGNIKIEMTRQL